MKQCFGYAKMTALCNCCRLSKGETYMEKIWRTIGRTAGVMMLLFGAFFVVYFWNLDKKLFSAVKSLFGCGSEAEAE